MILPLDPVPTAFALSEKGKRIFGCLLCHVAWQGVIISVPLHIPLLAVSKLVTATLWMETSVLRSSISICDTVRRNCHVFSIEKCTGRLITSTFLLSTRSIITSPKFLKTGDRVMMSFFCSYFGFLYIVVILIYAV